MGGVGGLGGRLVGGEGKSSVYPSSPGDQECGRGQIQINKNEPIYGISYI